MVESKGLALRCIRARPPLKLRAQNNGSSKEAAGALAPLPDTGRSPGIMTWHIPHSTPWSTWLEGPGASLYPEVTAFLVSYRAKHHTCRSGAIRADLIDLEGLRWHVSRAIVVQTEVTAFVEGTAQVGLPLGWVSLVHPLSVLPRLLSPGLRKEKKTADYMELYLPLRPQQVSCPTDVTAENFGHQAKPC